MKTTMLIGLILSALVLVGSGCGKQDGSGGTNVNRQPAPYPAPGPSVQPLNANRNLAFLMKNFASAVITPAPWAGYWYPYQTNGISAAAAKYDMVNRSSSVGWETSNHGLGVGGAADWWGHCNGWAAAAILAKEPRERKSIGGVEFAVGDQKALLTEMFMEVTGDFLGTRADDDSPGEAFNDVWPAQMFLLLTSVMGVQNRAVAIDRYTGYQVWNHPVVAYNIEPVTRGDYLGPDPLFPNIYRVNLSTRIYWVGDNVDPDIVTPAFDPEDASEVFESRILKYELWLDAPPQFDAAGNIESSGDIILTEQNGQVSGGIWKNSVLALVESHPDYMWVPTGPSRSSGFKNPVIDDDWVLTNTQ